VTADGYPIEPAITLPQGVQSITIGNDGTISATVPGQAAPVQVGSLHQDQNGQIVTADGYPIEPAITLPQGAQSITIGTDGTVSATLAGQAAPQQIGNIQLADFINPAGLQSMGQNLYLETASSGAPQTGQAGLNGMGTLLQGSLESSNVDIVEAMVDMIQTQRTYEMNSKSISAADGMLQTITNKT
ncbi:MAG TPA: flagellar hook-basal body complex protein, partial [Rhodanobacter sp.]|nr:flagellar hook-basal body complex protein [Rhodanobacter sp.]